VIVKRSLKHHLETAYSTEHIQATSIVLKDHLGELTITAVYSPPKHNIKTIDYEKFFQTLGHRFIAGGDYNAKNTYWGARTTTTSHRLVGAPGPLHRLSWGIVTIYVIIDTTNLHSSLCINSSHYKYSYQ